MIHIDNHLPLQYPGPVSRQRIFKLKLMWLFIATVGLGMALFSNAMALQSFGLGLVFPGAGYLMHVTGSMGSVLMHGALLVLSVLLFFAALFLWFWNGNLLAPMAVWVSSALLAGRMDHFDIGSTLCSAAGAGSPFPLAPLAAVSLLAASAWGAQTLTNKGLARQRDSLARRKAVITHIAVASSPRDADGLMREVKELSLDDIAAMRFALDRALQPPDEWNGFHFGDQWQPAATRYQVNTLGWALALANHNALPSMRGYLQEAQLNLIEKKKNHRLWSYWRWENLWGNLRWNADPMPIDNIMYSGYLGMQIGMYQAVTGDLRHDEPGAFTLNHPNGEQYVYDFPKITEIVSRQFFDNDYCLWPCEPNMIYPLCNVFGGIGLAAFDAAHGTSHWARIEPRFRAKLREEFTHIDGTIMALKAGHTGLPFVPGGISSLLTVAAWVSPLFADLAAVQWAMAKAELFDQADNIYHLRDRKALVFPDPGSYRRNYAFTLSNMLMAAAELGDRDVHKLCLELLAELMPATAHDGVLRHPEASIWAHAQFIMGRVGHTNGLHDLVRSGAHAKWKAGPLLSGASYPDVLVAKAVSDGTALELVLYPGGSRKRQAITLSQLRPGATYHYRASQAEAGQFVSSASGQVTLDVELNGRTSLLIHPR